MNVIYTKSVTKDVRKIKDEKLIEKIRKQILSFKESDSLNKINGVKKLSGHPYAFRIKIADYRLGFYYENNTITLSRFLKRNDIYKVFPD
jgi:mRNA interferase RelE/StbE